MSRRLFSSRTPFDERPLAEQTAALRSLITDEQGEIRPLIVRMARAAARDFFEEIREGFRLRMEQDPDFVAWQQQRREDGMAEVLQARKQLAEMRQLEKHQFHHALLGVFLVYGGGMTIDALELEFPDRDHVEINLALNELASAGRVEHARGMWRLILGGGQ